MAGGINLYSYAGNNPVSFSDPFGLCADSLHDANGRCPGGLTAREFDRAEYAARNHLTPRAGRRVLRLLYGGRIHSAALPDRKANGETLSNGEITLNTQSRNGNLFESHPAFLAYVLAHESAHNAQTTGWQGVLTSVKFLISPEATRQALEDEAYSFGCANSTSLVIKRNPSCHR